MRAARLLVGTSLLWIPLAFVYDGLTVLVLPAALSRPDGGGPAATWVGLVSFAGLAAAAVVQPFAGSLSDRLRPRVGRRRHLAVAAALLLAALALFGTADGPLAVALAFVAVLVSASLVQATLQPLVPDRIAPRWRGRAGGLKSAMDVGGAFLAFLLLGAVAGSPGASALVVGCAVLVALALTLVLLDKPGGDEPRGNEPGRDGSDAERVPVAAAWLVDLRASPGFGRLVAARFAFLLGTFAIGRFLVLLIADRLGSATGAAVQQSGALLALFTLVTAVATIPAGYLADRRGRTPLMVAGAAVSGVTVLALLLGGLVPVLIAGLGMAVGSAAFVAANWAAVTDVVPPAEAARYMGVANIGTAGAAAAAGLFGPAIDEAAQAGLDGFAVLAVLASASMLISLLPLRGAQLPAPTEPRPRAEGPATAPSA